MYVNRLVGFGQYAVVTWTLFFCNSILPQVLWFSWVRRHQGALLVVSFFVLIGIWLERYMIITTSLHRDYLPSSWKMFYPTWADYLQLVGGFGLFSTLFLLFVRFLPMIALSEVKACLPAADPRHAPRVEEVWKEES